MVQQVVKREQDVEFYPHPPYRDPGLTAELADIFGSADGHFVAVRWRASGPGQMLERPAADELIMITAGEAVVEHEGEKTTARPGDVILWLRDDPALISIPERLEAFCVAYGGG